MVETGSGKQNPETVLFSLRHLVQPPASIHILPTACLANCFFTSKDGGSITSLSSVPEPSPLLLKSSCFQRMETGERWSRNRVTEGRQAEQIGAKDPK